MCKDVHAIYRLLEESGVLGIAEFRRKLEPNRKTESVYRDLLSEAYAAHLFSSHGFVVTMRESPDLKLTYRERGIGAEVKRFQRKEQETREAQAMAEAVSCLVNYGDTTTTESIEAWRQVVSVAQRKRSQMLVGEPNLLVIESTSPLCIEDIEVLSAANELSILNRKGEYGAVKELNGIVVFSLRHNVCRGANVGFFSVRNGMAQIPKDALSILESMTTWSLGYQAPPFDEANKIPHQR